MKFSKEFSREHLDSLTVGTRVRVTSFGRTDAFGTIMEIKNREFWIVRLPRWQADASDLEVAVRASELELDTRPTSRRRTR